MNREVLCRFGCGRYNPTPKTRGGMIEDAATTTTDSEIQTSSACRDWRRGGPVAKLLAPSNAKNEIVGLFDTITSDISSLENYDGIIGSVYCQK
jgi:hypothetical protein